MTLHIGIVLVAKMAKEGLRKGARYEVLDVRRADGSRLPILDYQTQAEVLVEPGWFHASMFRLPAKTDKENLKMRRLNRGRRSVK